MTAILETLAVHEATLSECRRLSAEIAVLEDLHYTTLEPIFNDLYAIIEAEDRLDVLENMYKELTALNDVRASFFRAELRGAIYHKHPALREAALKRTGRVA